MSAEVLREAAALMRERAAKEPKATIDDPRISAVWLNSAHYLVMGPTFVLAVADMLDRAAYLIEFGDVGTAFRDQSLAVARAYLGRDA